MTFPNLAGLIKKDDVYQKGSGNFTANYVAWARIAQLLHEHAPGVEFHLEPTKEGSLIHKAPDGTGYVLCHFTNSEGFSSAQFPFPCMDHRNNPIQFDKISARVLTDTHRRALCACAAFTMSLGSELWARQEVEDAAGSLQDQQSPKIQTQQQAPKPKAEASPLQSQAAKAGAKAIANAKSLEKIAELTVRLSSRYTAGDLSEAENQVLMQMLLDQEQKVK